MVATNGLQKMRRQCMGVSSPRRNGIGSWMLLVVLCCCCWNVLIVLGASKDDNGLNYKTKEENDNNDHNTKNLKYSPTTTTTTTTTNINNNSNHKNDKSNRIHKDHNDMEGNSMFHLITDSSTSELSSKENNEYSNDLNNDDDFSSTTSSSSSNSNSNGKTTESTNHDNENGESTENKNKSAIQKEKMIPCLDYVPRCKEYVLQGLCRPYFTSSSTQTSDNDDPVQYVRNNCRQSCNLCHHNIDDTEFGTSVGVKQQWDFTDSPLVKPLDWGMTSKHSGVLNRAATETEHLIFINLLKTRIHQIEKSMNFYLQQIHQHTDDAEFQVLEESCRNRHPFCALWAVRGYCESDAPHMSEICAPICHSCSFLHRNSNGNITYVPHFYFYNSHWGGGGIGPGYSASPFHRYDLHGMIEAIAQDRVICTDVPPTLLSTLPMTVLPIKVHYSSVTSSAKTDDNFTTSNYNTNNHNKYKAQKFSPFPYTFPEHVSHPYIIQNHQNTDNHEHKKDWNTFLLPMSQCKAQIFSMPGSNSPNADIEKKKIYNIRKRHQPPTYKELENKDDLPPFSIDTIEEDPAHVIEFRDFLTKSECRAMLDIVRYGIGVDYNKQSKTSSTSSSSTTTYLNQKEDDDDDGFAPMSTDARPLTAKERFRYYLSEDDPSFKPIRLSSRINVFPTLKGNQSKKKKTHNYNNQMDQNVDVTPIQFAPVLERVLKKVELLLGFKANAHIELPVQFTKFEKEGFQAEQSHFMEALKVSMGALESDEEAHSGRYKVNNNINPYYDSDDDKKNYFAKEEDDINVMPNSNRNVYRHTVSGNVDEMEPQTMQNARVFGMIIFLSDVDSGGAVTFPKIKNLNFAPKMGKALLFPTTLSLLGENLSHIHPNLDENINHTGLDDSYLVEDLGSIFRHEVVKEGEKYILTLYFRRYPNYNIIQDDKTKIDSKTKKGENGKYTEKDRVEEKKDGLGESQFIVEEAEFLDHNSF